MRTRGAALFICTLAGAIVLYGLSRPHVDTYGANTTYRLHSAASFIPTEALMALSGEFKGIVADYLLLEAAGFIGSQQSSSASAEDWDAVARLLEHSSSLDPYFKQTYRLAQATLPWHAQKYDETLTILERSKRHLPWDWEPGFYMGFDYFYFLKDNLTASRVLMEAANVPNAPLTLATLAARLSSKAGQTRTAIAFLTNMVEKTENEGIKRELKLRITALEGVELIQTAVDRFQSQFERMPVSLDELVERSILTSLPLNPYNKPYALVEDKVEF